MFSTNPNQSAFKGCLC